MRLSAASRRSAYVRRRSDRAGAAVLAAGPCSARHRHQLRQVVPAFDRDHRHVLGDAAPLLLIVDGCRTDPDRSEVGSEDTIAGSVSEGESIGLVDDSLVCDVVRVVDADDERTLPGRATRR